MKKLIKDVDEERGIVQVTTTDERWYLKSVLNEITGLPEYKAVPSVSFISGSYPKGIQYAKWLADHGWDEAEAIKKDAGTKGSKVHQAIEAILNGREVRMDSKFTNYQNDQEEELTVEECDCILSFIAWRTEMEKTYEIETIIIDGSAKAVLFSAEYDYAGTIDWLIKLTNKKTKEVGYWLVDFKTSQNIWPSHEIQVSAYGKTIVNGENPVEGLPEGVDLKLAILQLGLRRNKCLYKWTEIKPQFDIFMATRLIWQKEHGTEKPSQKDYPLVLSAGNDTTLEEVVDALDITFQEPTVDDQPKKKRHAKQ